MKPVIKISGISKSYEISHQTDMKADYGTLKDDFAKLLKKPFGSRGEDKQETFWALKDVSFEVNPGEIFGIIGRNGAGKSTLLKILSRITEPTKGEVKMQGRVASLLEVGTGFHPELTGRENIFFNGSILGMSRNEIRRKFDEIVAFSEVEKFLDTPVKFYSSGMYVRLAFSVAAHLDSEILILDEVLAVGDASFQKKSLDKILSTMEEGRTVLFVSHGMDSVRRLCSRGLLLDKGRVNYIGDTEDLIDKYLSDVGAEPDESVLKTKWYAKKVHDNHYFIPKRIYISDAKNNENGGHLKHDNDYWFCVEGKLKTESDKFNVGYVIRNEESKSLLYISLSTDGPIDIWPKLKLGNVTFRGKLPKNLLNGGSYRASLIASFHNDFWIYSPDDETPSIQFVVDNKIEVSPYWTAARSGAIAPLIEWEISKHS